MIEVLQLLHNLSSHSTRYSATYYVRHLDKDEPVPLECGIPDSNLIQRDWIWVAYSSTTDQPLAILVAAPCQGLAFLMRMYGTEASTTSVWVGLLRKSMADMYSRGYTKYAVPLSLSKPIEAKLARIIKRAGGSEAGEHVIFHGPTDIGKL